MLSAKVVSQIAFVAILSLTFASGRNVSSAIQPGESPLSTGDSQFRVRYELDDNDDNSIEHDDENDGDDGDDDDDDDDDDERYEDIVDLFEDDAEDEDFTIWERDEGPRTSENRRKLYADRFQGRIDAYSDAIASRRNGEGSGTLSTSEHVKNKKIRSREKRKEKKQQQEGNLDDPAPDGTPEEPQASNPTTAPSVSNNNGGNGKNKNKNKKTSPECTKLKKKFKKLRKKYKKTRCDTGKNATKKRKKLKKKTRRARKKYKKCLKALNDDETKSPTTAPSVSTFPSHTPTNIIGGDTNDSPVVLPSAASSTNAVFDESATKTNVESAYTQAIISILKTNNVSTEHLSVEVEAIEEDCGTLLHGAGELLTNKKCFKVQFSVIVDPSKTDVSPAEAIGIIESSVAQGDFSKTLEDFIVDPHVLPSATTSTYAAFDQELSSNSDDVEDAYEKAIKAVLESNDIILDNVFVNVEAVEENCRIISQGIPQDLLAKNCFEIEASIISDPFSENGINPSDAIALVKSAIKNGDFEKYLENTGSPDVLVLSKAISSTQAILDDSFTSEDIETGYVRAIRATLEKSGVNVEDVLVEANVLAKECNDIVQGLSDILSEKNCYDVEFSIATAITTGVDPDVAIQKVQDSIDQGDFTDIVTKGISLPSASSTTVAGFQDDSITPEAVETAYEQAIKKTLSDTLSLDDVAVEVTATEKKCEASDDSSPSSCFGVKFTLTPGILSGISPEAAVLLVKNAIAQGEFVELLGLPDSSISLVSSSASATSKAGFSDPELRSKEVEIAFEEAIKAILSTSGIDTDKLVAGVEATRADCIGGTLAQTCFDVEYQISSSIFSGVDPTDAIEAIDTAIADGRFGGILQAVGFDGADIPLAATALCLTNSSFQDENLTPFDIEKGYLEAIKQIDPEMMEDIGIEVEVTEEDCGATNSTRKCFEVGVSISPSPETGLTPESVVDIIETSINDGTFEVILDSLDLIGADVSVAVPSGLVTTVAELDEENTNPLDVEIAFNKAIKKTLTDNKIVKSDQIHDIGLEVTATEKPCKTETSKKCFEVDIKVAPGPFTDATPDDVIESIETAIKKGDFDDVLSSTGGLTGANVSVPLPSASSTTNVSIGDDSVSSSTIEIAYEDAIKSTLSGPGVVLDDVTVEVGAIEKDCETGDSGVCYEVQISISAPPSSGIVPKDAIEDIETAIVLGDFDKFLNLSENLTDPVVTIPPVPSAKSVTNISVSDESVSVPQVETAYEDAIKAVMKGEGLPTDDVEIEVVANPRNCDTIESSQKCFGVGFSITASPSSGVDPETTIKAIETAIAIGDFENILDSSGGLTEPNVSLPPPFSKSLTNIALDDESVSSDSVEIAYENVIKELLKDSKIQTDGIIVEVEAAEKSCSKLAGETIDSSEKCFGVDFGIIAAPSTGVNPDDAIELINRAIEHGDFAQSIQLSGLTGAIVSFPPPSATSITDTAFDNENITLEEVETAYKEVVIDTLEENFAPDDFEVEVVAEEKDCNAVEVATESSKNCFQVKTSLTGQSPLTGSNPDAAINIIESIDRDEFSKNLDSSRLTGSQVSEPLFYGESATNVAFDEGVSEEDVKVAYDAIIKGILENNAIDNMFVSVDVDEKPCEQYSDRTSEDLYKKECFQVLYSVTTSSTGMNPTDVIEIIKTSIDQDDFANLLEKVGLPAPITISPEALVLDPDTDFTSMPTLAPTTIPSAFAITNAAVDENSSEESVERAYEKAIIATITSSDSLLSTVETNSGVLPQGVEIEVEADEKDCDEVIDGAAEILAGKKCYEVEYFITAPPYTGLNADDAINEIKSAILRGDFANILEDKGNYEEPIVMLTATGVANGVFDQNTSEDDVQTAYEEAIYTSLNDLGLSEDVSVEVDVTETPCEAMIQGAGEAFEESKCYQIEYFVTAPPDSGIDPDGFVTAIEPAISQGSFADALSTAGLTGEVEVVETITKATGFANGVFDENIGEDEVQAAYEDSIKATLEGEGFNMGSVFVEVETTETPCGTIIQGAGDIFDGKKCYQVKYSVSANPSSGVDPDGAVRVIDAAIQQGSFSSTLSNVGLDGDTGVLEAAITASGVANAVFDDDASTDDIKSAYEEAIKATLEAQGISSDNIFVKVDPKEIPCGALIQGADAAFEGKKCYQLEYTVSANPSAGVNTKKAIDSIESAIHDGSFSDELSIAGLRDGILANDNEDIIITLAPTISPVPSASPTKSAAPSSSFMPTTFYPRCQVERRSDPGNQVDIVKAIKEGWIEATFSRRLENIKCINCANVEFFDCRDVECVEANSCTDVAFTSTAEFGRKPAYEMMNVQCIGDESCNGGIFTGLDKITCRGENSCTKSVVKSSEELECLTDESCRGLEFK